MLIVIPFALPWDWPADYERQTARLLAEKHDVVAFLVNEGQTLRNLLFSDKRILSKIDGYRLFRPIDIIPFQRFRTIKRINISLAVLQLLILIFLLYRLKSKWRCFWSFSLQNSVSSGWFKSPRWIRISDCVDDEIELDRKGLLTTSQMNILHSDLVFTNTEVLYRIKKTFHKNVYRVPVGFDEDIFRDSPTREPRILKSLPHPRVGIVGVFNARIDRKFLYETIIGSPGIPFVLIGPIDEKFPISKGTTTVTEWMRTIQKLPNVLYIGHVPKNDIAHFISHIDFGFIPYDIRLQFNRRCFPQKTLEFFYFGKPVVSTKIPSLDRIKPLTVIVDSPIKAAMSFDFTNTSPDLTRQRRQYAIKNNRRNKIITMLKIIDQHKTRI